MLVKLLSNDRWGISIQSAVALIISIEKNSDQNLRTKAIAPFATSTTELKNSLNCTKTQEKANNSLLLQLLIIKKSKINYLKYGGNNFWKAIVKEQ